MVRGKSPHSLDHDFDLIIFFLFSTFLFTFLLLEVFSVDVVPIQNFFYYYGRGGEDLKAAV